MFETSAALQSIDGELHPWQPGVNLSEAASAIVTFCSIDFTSHEFLETGRVAALPTLEDEPRQQLAVADLPQAECADEEWADQEFANEEEEEEEEEEPTVTMSATDFASLEERVARVVEVVKQEREALKAAEERASHAEEELNRQTPQLAALESELTALRSERQQARQRLNDLLGELESLEF